MRIRAEEERDWAAVRRLNISAFETLSEADLVDTLRQQARPVISLVAEESQSVVGHIMLSPAELSGHSDLKMMALAPMAVAPEHQRKGVGSALVRTVLAQATQQGCEVVVVLGHPAYYPRFGFLQASLFGVDCEYDVPSEAFMAIELQQRALAGRGGRVRYHAAFANL